MSGSLAFVDESGGLGRRPGRGSSRAFVLALVLFDESAAADRCRERIDALRADLGRRPDREFHFNGDDRAVQRSFVQAVRTEQFRYFTATFLKPSTGSIGPPEVLSHAFARLFSATSAELAGGTISIDGSADRVARRRLMTALRQQFAATGERGIRTKLQRSQSDSLLQLADYIAGVVRKSAEGQIVAEELYRMFKPRRGKEFRL